LILKEELNLTACLLFDRSPSRVKKALYGAKNRIRIYPGQYEDQETGLHYNYMRYYDFQVGRYLKVDPMGIEGGINLFAYSINNPISLFDSMGLKRVILKEIEYAEYEFWASNYTSDNYDPHEFPNRSNYNKKTEWGDVPDCYILIDTKYKKKKEWVHIRIIYNVMGIWEITTYIWGPDPDDPCCEPPPPGSREFF